MYSTLTPSTNEVPTVLQTESRPHIVSSNELNPIILHDNARSHTAAAVKDLAMGDSGTSIVLTRYDPRDYDLFTKVKEPLRGTRYNTRDELIRAIGRSIRNINKDGRADGVRRLPNIWQKRFADLRRADRIPGHVQEFQPRCGNAYIRCPEIFPAQHVLQSLMFCYSVSERSERYNAGENEFGFQHRKLPNIYSYWVEGKPWKKPQPGNFSQAGFEPGPPGFAVRCASHYFTDVDNY
ncbi:hypothetical protein ANN_12672 [Periplaneta americana]|uniref:Mariner Mos1 transposase n=1 Tax=Periplaneta americana TaxID=6978 RepID=A0ABQ8TIM4_PERAM|nr:hypothetical protein ANN_12672 [Periplaneta americana]